MSNASFIFISLGKLHSTIQYGYISLHFHQKYKNSLSLNFLQDILLLDFWVTAILSWVRWYLREVSICISLISRDIEHFFMDILTIYISEKYLFWVVSFLTVPFILGNLIFKSLCILDIILLSKE